MGTLFQDQTDRAHWRPTRCLSQYFETPIKGVEGAKGKIATRLFGSIIYANLALPSEINAKSQISTPMEQCNATLKTGWESKIREGCFQLLKEKAKFKLAILADLDCLFYYNNHLMVEVHHQARVHSYIRSIILSILENDIKVFIILPSMFERDEKFIQLFEVSRNLARSLIADDSLQPFWRNSSIRLFSGLDWLCRIRSSNEMPIDHVLDYDSTGNVISWGKQGYKELSLFVSEQIVGWVLDYYKGEGHVKRGTELYLIQPILASDCDDLLKGALAHLYTPFFKGSVIWGTNIHSHVTGMVIPRSTESVLGNRGFSDEEIQNSREAGQPSGQKQVNHEKRKFPKRSQPLNRAPPPGSTLLGTGYPNDFQGNWHQNKAHQAYYNQQGYHY